MEVSGNQIKSYDSNGIRIGENYTQFPCFVFGTNVRTDFLPAEFDLLDEEHLKFLDSMEPEVIIVGTGPSQRFPDARQLDSKRSIEYMDTGSACRIYNILVSENRSVLAVLY